LLGGVGDRRQHLVPGQRRELYAVEIAVELELVREGE